MSDTPETDSEANNGSLCDQCVPAEFARKLERERDEARFDLAFRRDLCALQQKQLDEVCLERNEWKEVAEGSLLGAIHERDEARELAANLEISLTAAIRSANVRQDETEKAMSQRDKAVRACHIWQDGHSEMVADRDYWRAEAERWREVAK